MQEDDQNFRKDVCDKWGMPFNEARVDRPKMEQDALDLKFMRMTEEEKKECDKSANDVL